MQEERKVSIANFNCTFNVEAKSYPLLDYFFEMFLPAIKNYQYTRKSGDNEFFITDVQLIEIDENEYALIGKHVKRVILQIKNDFSLDSGFIHVGKDIPSAPFSTFILLLRNHRLIYFPDQKGSPDIRSFSTTIRDIVDKHRNTLYYSGLNELKNTNMVYDDISFKSTGNFRDYFDLKYPEANIHVIPIPSAELVTEKMKDIEKIKSLTFRMHALNSEICFNPMFESVRQAMTEMQCQSVSTTFPSPKSKENVENYLKNSEGKSDFLLVAKTKNQDEVKIKPDSLTELIPISIDILKSFVDSIKDIYNSLKSNKEIRQTSEENKKTYEKHREKIKRNINR